MAIFNSYVKLPGFISWKSTWHPQARWLVYFMENPIFLHGWFRGTPSIFKESPIHFFVAEINALNGLGFKGSQGLFIVDFRDTWRDSSADYARLGCDHGKFIHYVATKRKIGFNGKFLFRQKFYSMGKLDAKSFNGPWEIYSWKSGRTLDGQLLTWTNWPWHCDLTRLPY